MNLIEHLFLPPAFLLGTTVPDTVLGFCQVLFVGALLPTVFGQDKPHILTAAATTVGGALTAWALFKSGLVLGGVLTAGCAALWLAIFAQCCYLKLARR